MGVGESFKFLAASPYIRDLALLVSLRTRRPSRIHRRAASSQAQIRPRHTHSCTWSSTNGTWSRPSATSALRCRRAGVLQVVSYGISINLVEVTWKSKIKQQFPNPNDYSAFMGDFSSSTGAVTFAMMLLSRFIFRKFGWGVAALITPTVLLLTGKALGQSMRKRLALGFLAVPSILLSAAGFAFFGLILGGDVFAPTIASLGLTPLFAAVLVGAAQNVFSKSAKYSLFDPCKEMAYIPLDKETQVRLSHGQFLGTVLLSRSGTKTRTI